VESTHSHLREDGTVWPPVTPEPPMPPGYQDPTAVPVEEPEAAADPRRATTGLKQA